MGEIDYDKLAEKVADRMCKKQTGAPALEGCEKPVRCTVCLLTWNSMDWLTLVLKQLTRQGERVDIMVADNGSSDGVAEYITNPKVKKLFEGMNGHSIRKFIVLDPVIHQPGVEINVARGMKKFAEYIETPYMFHLDDDVFLPPGCVRTMIDEMEADKEQRIGALGCPYDNVYDHVEMGALLMRTPVAREIDYKHEPRCVCTNLAKALEDRGLKMTYSRQVARFADHLKYMRL